MTDTTRLGLVFPSGEDRRLLVKRLGDAGYEVVTATSVAELPAVDCLVIAPNALQRDRTALADRREASDPVYLPVLLVVADRGTGDPLSGLSAALAGLVDDAVVAPVRGAELDRRVEGLLRARRLSARLEESRDRYQRLLAVLPEAVLLLDGRRIRYCNAVADRLLGRQADTRGEAAIVESATPTGTGGESGVENGVRRGSADAAADATDGSAGPGRAADAGSSDSLSDLDRDRDSGTDRSHATSSPDRVETASVPVLTDPPDDDTVRLEGRAIDDVVPGSAGPTVDDLLEDLETGAGGEGTFVETPLVSLDGRRIVAEVGGTRVEVGGETLTQLVVRDVTTRRQREEQLRLFRRAMDEASVGVTITDPSQPDNPIVYANEKFGELTGRDPEWMLGRNPRFAQCAETDPDTVARLRAAIDRAEPISVELRNQRADGTLWWNALDVTPVRDADGEVTHFLGFQRDVTERRERAETFEKLHAVTERLQAATDTDEVVAVAIEAARGVLDMPLTACWRPDGSGVLQPVAATDAGWAVDPSSVHPGELQYDLFEAGEVTTMDVNRVDETDPIDEALYIPLGEYGIIGAAERGVESYPKYVVDAGRMLADHVTAALERTEREATLRDRERELERYETVVEAAGDPIYTLDSSGRFTDVNDAMVAFTGYDRAQLLGEHVSVIMGAADIEQCEQGIASLLYGADETVTEAVTVTTATGQARKCEINIALLPPGVADGEEAESQPASHSPEGRPPAAGESDGGADTGRGELDGATGFSRGEGRDFPGTVGVNHDVTEREQRRERLAVLDRVLRHNIRNKVNVIHGRASGIDPTADPAADVGTDLEAVVTAAEELLDVAETARAFHRSQASASRERDAVEIVETVIADGADDWAEIERRYPASAPVVVDDGLDLALAKLLENAIDDAADPANVGVRIDRDIVDDREWVTLTIQTDGEWLDPAEEVALEGSVESPLEHGSGIGLWLVAWTVRRCGGRLQYDRDGDRMCVSLLLPPA
jgi:PAS domain S-box-containing protein